jgi:NodT family efflux transporter outer membrane factor (OMF) lipoprotein
MMPLSNFRTRTAATIAAFTLLAGCKVGPNYKAPEVKVQPSFAEAKIPTTPTTRPSTSLATTRPVEVTQWWATFRDPQLDALIDRAMKGNLTLKQAASRVRQARYQKSVVGSELFPTVNTHGGYNRSRGSENVTIPPGAFGVGAGTGGAAAAAAATPAARSGSTAAVGNRSGMVAQPAQVSGGSATVGGNSGPAAPQSVFGSGGGLPGVTTSLWEVGFDATWEVDVFGGQARAVEAADADIAAATEDHRDVLVTLLAEVARTYIELRGYQRQLDIARQNLAAQQDTLDLTTSKFKAGFVTQFDVARQATIVATTASTLPALEAQVRISMHALGVLMGEDPDALAAELSKPSPIPPVPPEVPIGLPSELMRRRPDIRRAEWRLAAATARIGEATAELYPKFSITGAFGFDSTKAKHILDWSSRYWSIAPGLSWPIFDAGRIRANIDVQNELQQQAMDNYEQTVLTALKDVEDSLALYRTEQLRRRALADAVDSSKQAVDLARQQYEQGVADFLAVLDAERAEFAAEDSLAQSDRAISTDLVSLYKALGGGWEVAIAGG